jgi:3-isopropylmalate dehydrogenase
MTPQRIAVIPGDGIGMEVARAGVSVLEAVAARHALNLDVVWFDLGADRYLRTGETLTDAVFESLRDDFAAIYLGALGDPRVPDLKHAKDILLGLRFRLDLYVNYRPAKLLHPDLTPLKGKGPADLDLVVYRENTEGLYAGVGGRFKQGTPDEVAITEMLVTRKGVERILRAAFEHAQGTPRRRLCMADKSNAISHAHGLWRDTFNALKAEYPTVDARHLYADVLAMELVRAPEDFEVIVISNLLGDVLSDLSAQLVGGLGLAPSANLHPGKAGLFEPVHGSAPPLAGKDVANPLAMILTGAEMVRWLGHEAAAVAIEQAVAAVLEAGETTADLGGSLGTVAAAEAVVARLA